MAALTLFHFSLISLEKGICWVAWGRGWGDSDNCEVQIEKFRLNGPEKGLEMDILSDFFLLISTASFESFEKAIGSLIWLWK